MTFEMLIVILKPFRAEGSCAFIILKNGITAKALRFAPFFELQRTQEGAKVFVFKG